MPRPYGGKVGAVCVEFVNRCALYGRGDASPICEPLPTVGARRCLAHIFLRPQNSRPVAKDPGLPIVGGTDAVALTYTRQPRRVRARRCLARIFPRSQIREPPCAVGARHFLALAPWCDVVGVATLRPYGFCCFSPTSGLLFIFPFFRILLLRLWQHSWVCFIKRRRMMKRCKRFSWVSLSLSLSL